MGQFQNVESFEILLIVLKETAQSFKDNQRIIWLLLGVTVHEFMLINICQCLCHIMKVSWSHGFIGFVVHRFRGVMES